MTMVSEPLGSNAAPAGQMKDRYDGPQGAPATSQRDDFAQMVKTRWEEASEPLKAQRREYWINLSFFLREHWIWWDYQRNVLQQLAAVNTTPFGVGRKRVTVNRYGENLMNVLGRLLKSLLAFEVVPTDAADSQIEGARRAEKVLQAEHDDKGWESTRFDEVFAALLGGTSAVLVEWDGQAGDELEWDEQNQQVIGTGATDLRALNINEFAFEPGVRRFLDARWWIVNLALPVGSVSEHFGLSWVPKPDAMTFTSPLQTKLLEGSGRSWGKNLCSVLTYYERPNRKNREGQYGVVVNERTIYKGPWPFKTRKPNLIPFRQRRVDGRWVGVTYASDAVPVQVQYNEAHSVLAEHSSLIGNARLMAPYGSFLEEDLSDDPGGVLWFAPESGGAVPQYLVPPNLPRWVAGRPEDLAGVLDDLMHVHDISKGQGFDRASGQALALLAEKDDSPLGFMAFEQQEGWQRVAELVLELYAENAKEQRSSVIQQGPGAVERVDWSGEMLQGQTNVKVPLDAVAPVTHAARLAFAKDLWDRKVITDPRQYARMVGLSPDQFEELLDADAAKAHRENLRMMIGKAEIPEDFDNHPVHIAEHNRFRKSDAYRYAGAEERSIIDDHIEYHQWKEEQAYLAQVQRAQTDPGLAQVAQANEPPGSLVPPDAAEQQALEMQNAQGGGAGGGTPQGPPPTTSPALQSDTGQGAFSG